MICIQQKVLRRLWGQVRAEFGYPALPAPSLSDHSPTSHLHVVTKEIGVNPKYLKVVSEGMGEEAAARGLLAHEMGHHMICPWDLSTHLLLYASVRKVADNRDEAQAILQAFEDVIVNTALIRKGREDVKALWTALPKNTDEGRLITALYERLWSTDLGAGKEYGKLAERLARLPYHLPSRWPSIAGTFARMVSGIVKTPVPFCGHDGMAGIGEEEGQRALKRIAQECGSPHLYRKILEDFEDELSAPGTLGTGGRGRGPGPIKAEVAYYMHLAEAYDIRPKKEPGGKSGSQEKYALKDYESDSPFHAIDLLASFGKILPGISKRWEYREGEAERSPADRPQPLLVLLDSSASMDDPTECLSLAALAAGCLADATMRSGGKVAVYNFGCGPSGDQLAQDYTSDRRKVYEGLCTYFGGGTNVSLARIEKLRRQEPRTDVALISDLGIGNPADLAAYLERQGKGRVSVIGVGGGDDLIDSRLAPTYTIRKLKDVRGLGERYG